MRRGAEMLVFQILILGISLLAVPILVGSLFQNVDKCAKSPFFWWISGQMLLWAGFQVICVPMILLQCDFQYVVWIFGGYTAALMAAAGLLLWYRHSRQQGALSAVREKQEKKPGVRLLWCLFGALLLFQLVQAVRLTYADWDDAYYVAVSSITEDANSMYQKLPYTGGATELDARHGLAPFPIWITFLARISGMQAVSVAHVIVPVVLIAMTYGIYYLIGSKLFGKKGEKLPLFLIFTELLVLFGNYSIYSAENFMLARSRQGKAALGNIIVPALFLLFLMLTEKVQKEKKASVGYWVLLFSVLLSACLCSTMGAALASLLLVVTGGCVVVGYKRWRLLLPFAICCIPGAVFFLLYVVMR